MRRTKKWQQTLVATGGACCALIFLSNIAKADLYQNVVAGQTLGQLANHFGVSSDALRTTNDLHYADNAALPAMMLRIPDATAVKRTPRPESTVTRLLQTHGSLTSTQLYVVRANESWESISRFFTKQGYDLSADELRRQNPSFTTLRAGNTLQIALTRHYDNQSGDSASFDSVDTQSSNDVQVIPQPKPLFEKTSMGAPRQAAVRRGPADLSSRGGYGMSGGNIQVLRGNETVQPAVNSTFSDAKKYARVAKVMDTGARIRRSPDPQSQTLFVCPVGTQLAVTGQKGYWYAVLMSDRSTGWLPAKYVDVMQQQIDTNTQVVTGAKAAALLGGSSLQQQDGQFSSNNPIISYTLGWLGTPYVYGGESRSGIDCSSLVQHAFAANGIQLPRTAAEQATVGVPVAVADLQPGDRLYFSSSRTHIDHTGIYMGDGKFIHASGSRHGVTISNLSDSFYQRIYAGARR